MLNYDEMEYIRKQNNNKKIKIKKISPLLIISIILLFITLCGSTIKNSLDFNSILAFCFFGLTILFLISIFILNERQIKKEINLKI